MKTVFLIAFFSIVFVNLHAQTYPVPNYGNEPSIQSPNAFQFGKFGEIPVSLFNGTPDVSIPITTLRNGNISIPVKLRYDASGCRPDQHPGLVGLNWGLDAGGVIKRHTNGCFDEYIYINKNAYYDTYYKLNISNWMNMLGYGYGDDLAPDEFSFSFNGISGSFMLDHEGKWIVKSKENLNLKIEHQIQENYILTDPNGVGQQNLPRAFTKFTITTNDGTQYIFGREQKAIEFSRPYLNQSVASYNVRGPGGPGSGITYSSHEIVRGIQPSAWHLSEIISPYGQHVNFYYSSEFTAQQSTYSTISYNPCGVWYTYDVNQSMTTLINSSYLDSIKSDNNIACYFSRSISNELPWMYNGLPLNLNRFQLYFPYTLNTLIKYYKLDDVVMKVKNQLVSKVSLGYIEKNTERLKLNRVREHSVIDDKIASEYSLEYNATMLPAYNSGLEDHWGFFNNQNFWGNYSSTNPVSVPDLNAYYASRQPNETSMKAESLSRLIYPTGGYTDFFFEPHTYSKVIKQNSTLTIESLPSNFMAGGLRIKKTETYDKQSVVPILKEYFYTNDYINAGSASSGILSGEPVYYEEGVNHLGYSFTHFDSAPLNYLNTTDGNHITYSQVTEKSDEGYIVYDYTNHDNGYLDKEPFNRLNGISHYSNYRSKAYGKLELERGLSLSIKYFASDKFLLKKIAYEYNDDPNRYNSYVRTCLNFGDAYNCAFNVVSYPLYTFYPFLKKQTTTEYFRSGGQLSTATTYAYDAASNLLRSQSTLNSNGNTIKKSYRYPTDYTTNFSVAYWDEAYDLDALRTANIVSIPVEITSSVVKPSSGEYVTASEMRYFENLKLEKQFQLELESPIVSTGFSGTTVSSSGFTADSRYKEKANFSQYDAKGNLLEMTNEEGLVITYLWAYESSHAVAKIVNVSYTQIVTLLGSIVLSNLASSFDQSLINSIVDQVRVGFPNAQVYAYNYKPGVGITAEVDPANSMTSYTYDGLNRLSIVKNGDNDIVKRYTYNYNVDKRISSSPSNLSFGLTSSGVSKSLNVAITNIGNQPVTINSLQLPTGFTYTGGAIVIPSGQVTQLTINFIPSTSGNYSGTVTINSDATGVNTFNVEGICGTTKIISVTGNLAYGNVQYPNNVRPMTITNSGSGILTVTSITYPSGFGGNWSSGTIAAGQSKIVNVTAGTAGSGTIQINSDMTSGSNTIPVSCNSVAPH